MHLLKLMWYLVRCASWRDCFSAAKNVPRVQDSAGCRFDRGECDDSFVRIQKVRTVLGLIIALHSFLGRSILDLLCFLPILLMAVTRRPFRVIFSHFPLVRILPPPPPALGPPPADGRGGSGVPGAAEASISAVPGKSEEYCTVW